MIQQLDEAKRTLLMLADENAKLRAELTALKGPPKPTTPASLTPLWDRFNAITEPAERTRFYNANEAALKSEMKNHNERNG
jgi:streptomycin 6-kinase